MERFRLPNRLILSVFSDCFRVRVSLSVLAVSGNVFHLVFRAFWSRAQKAEMRKSTHSPSENLFFQGTRRHRARHREGNRRPQTAPKIYAIRQINMSKNCDFSSALGSTLKIRPKMTSRSSPASLRGAPREAQERSKSGQGLPKTTPRAGQRATRAAHRAAWAAIWGTPGAQKPPEASRTPFWSPRGSILFPSGIDFRGRPRPGQGAPGSFGGPMLGQY